MANGHVTMRETTSISVCQKPWLGVSEPMVNLSSNEEGCCDLHTEGVVVPMVNPSSYGEGQVMEIVCVPKAMAGRSCGRALPKQPHVKSLQLATHGSAL